MYWFLFFCLIIIYHCQEQKEVVRTQRKFPLSQCTIQIRLDVITCKSSTIRYCRISHKVRKYRYIFNHYAARYSIDYWKSGLYLAKTYIHCDCGFLFCTIISLWDGIEEYLSPTTKGLKIGYIHYASFSSTLNSFEPRSRDFRLECKTLQ